jgi:histidyl-tRNA synthetase
VLGGGRYDGLIESLGGAPTPAVGWAAGIERLAMMIEAPSQEKISVALIALGDAADAVIPHLLAQLRRSGVLADAAFRGNMKKRLAKADAAGAMIVVILGEDELAKGEVAIKELASGEQVLVPMDRLADRIGFALNAHQLHSAASIASLLSGSEIGFISEPVTQ